MQELTGLLPAFGAKPTDRVWLVAAHGGAGCTTIRHSAPDRYADAGRALPISMDSARPSRIVLCAMCTGRGLEALRGLLGEWHHGGFGSSRLCGVAVTMPTPRTPTPLRKGCLLVGSAAPALWRLPYIKGLDLDGFPQVYPRAYRHMLNDLEAVANL